MKHDPYCPYCLFKTIEISYKYKGIVVLAICVPLMMACTFLSKMFTSESMPLSYIGKIRFGQPITEGELTRISLSFQGGKLHENSIRVLMEVTATLHRYEIYFTVVTCLSSWERKKVEPEIRLKRLAPGTYRLIYQNPDQVSILLGEIEINGN